MSPKEAAITVRALMLFDKAGKTRIKSYRIINSSQADVL